MTSTLDLPDKHTILVADDTPDNLAWMSHLLRDLYGVSVAPSGARALQIMAAEPKPDLILLDIMVPQTDGCKVLRHLQANAATRDIPVIFLSAMNAAEDETTGLAPGAVDYITKPINPAIVLARVRNQLQLNMARDFLKNQSAYLERTIEKRTHEGLAVQDVTIHILATLAQIRDNETGQHMRRTQNYVRALATRLQRHPRFQHLLDDAAIDAMCKSASLHDIGKMGIPGHILLKPGKLTAAEFETMKTHTTLSRDAIARAEATLGHSRPFLRYAKEMAYSHHEKWDGSGYPQGLVGDSIPVSARLMAVADVYDALTSQRTYKPAFPHAKAVAVIQDDRGRHFDPDMADAFSEIADEFQAIARGVPTPTFRPRD